MGGTYEVTVEIGYDLHTKFHKEWFSHSKVEMGVTQTHTHNVVFT
jgi:hypothetical protein